MIRVVITNMHSDHYGKTAMVSSEEWKGNSFWVGVNIGGHALRISRQYLREI
jgi:hypothetical protein